MLTLLAIGACSSGAPTPAPSPSVADTADSHAPEPVEAFTPCGPAAFPDAVARVHTCPEPCEGPFEACTWDSTAETGWPSRSLRFVAAGRGGTLRYANEGGPTLLVHHGGTGTEYAPRKIPDAFAAAGGRPVEVVWQTSSATGTRCDDAECGWLTRPLDEVPSSIQEVSARPAAVVRWVHDHLAAGATYGTLACSAGSLATFYARAFDDLDPLLDYQMFIGGPLVFSAPWACEGRPDGCGGAECGRCRTDPSVVCEVGGGPAQCLGAGGSCASYRLTGMLGVLEAVYRNQAECPAVVGTDYAGGDLATGAADAEVEHPIDIVLNTTALPEGGDDDLGISPNAWEIAQALTGPDIAIQQEDGPHCAALLGATTCERVLQRMGLGAQAASHCEGPVSDRIGRVGTRQGRNPYGPVRARRVAARPAQARNGPE